MSRAHTPAPWPIFNKGRLFSKGGLRETRKTSSCSETRINGSKRADPVFSSRGHAREIGDSSKKMGANISVSIIIHETTDKISYLVTREIVQVIEVNEKCSKYEMI